MESTITNVDAYRQKRVKKSFFNSMNTKCYLMLSPMLIGFMLFTLYPMFWLIKWAWFDYDGFSSGKFIGFDNFVRVFERTPDYWNSLLNTFAVSFGKLIIELPLALVLAILINNKTKCNSIYRTVFFMPTIVSTAIVGLTFYILFEPYQGIVNNLIKLTSIAPVNWFGSKWVALTVIAIAGIWQSFGINMVFFLMGLQSVPKELYECGEIDGATGLKKFFHITIPMLAPIIQVVVMLAIIGSMKMTDLVLVLTNGQPGGQSEVVMTYVFKYFFSYGRTDTQSQFGFASSMSVVTAMVLAIMTFLYLKLTKKMSKIY